MYVILLLFPLQVDQVALSVGMGLSAGLAVIFAVLGVWARSRILPPASIGLGLLTALMVLSILDIISEKEPIRLSVVVQSFVQLVLAALLIKTIWTAWTATRPVLVEPSALAPGQSESANRKVVNGAQGGADGHL
jgi:hypothetical protein